MDKQVSVGDGRLAKLKRFSAGVNSGLDKRIFAQAMILWGMLNFFLAWKSGAPNFNQIEKYLNADFLALQLLANFSLFAVIVVAGYFGGHAGSRSVVKGEGFKMAELVRNVASKQMLAFGAGVLASASAVVGEKSALLIAWGAWSNFPQILWPFIVSFAAGVALVYGSGVVNFKFK